MGVQSLNREQKRQSFLSLQAVLGKELSSFRSVLPLRFRLARLFEISPILNIPPLDLDSQQTWGKLMERIWFNQCPFSNI
jgi:hypothetical protein